jgi:hypothetical protein
MIDLHNETLLGLAEAAARLPWYRRGRPKGKSTVLRPRPMTASAILRWVLSGVRGPDGKKVKLEANRLGGRWVTSVEALQRFSDRQTPDESKQAPTPRSPAARRRASERADRELDELGI